MKLAVPAFIPQFSVSTGAATDLPLGIDPVVSINTRSCESRCWLADFVASVLGIVRAISHIGPPMKILRPGLCLAAVTELNSKKQDNIKMCLGKRGYESGHQFKSVVLPHE